MAPKEVDEGGRRRVPAHCHVPAESARHAVRKSDARKRFNRNERLRAPPPKHDRKWPSKRKRAPFTERKGSDLSVLPGSGPEAAPYPDYPGGHPTATQAAASILEALFGAEPGRFSVTGSGGKVRQFDTFDAFAREVVDARVWGGVHWRSSDVAGAVLGRRVAEYVLQRQR